ncbi:MAG: aminotransferase class V-fold PLP-dependent enzyme [Spirochaetes bacterium]|nr:aminotransferase class V-fold PLP-dependent enzyme [Spirochaetota bacterium]
MSEKIVYLDYNATTPIHPEVKKTIIENFDIFGNPSSLHTSGRIAMEKINEARSSVAKLINADSEEIIFTAGASESNNTVLKYVVCQPQSDCGEACRACAGRNEIITSAIEHPSIISTMDFIKGQGGKPVVLGVKPNGKIDLDLLEKNITHKTALISIIMANNEIGVIEDIKTIASIAKKHGVLVHTDAVSAAGRIKIDVKDLNVDYLSLSGHKIYAPKGIGILYVKKDSPYCPFIHGGHQEAGRRAGTLNNLGIIAMGKAAELALSEMETESKRIKALRDKLRDGIVKTIPDISVNGDQGDILPNTLNVSFMGAEGETILLYLDMEGIAVSTGSACSSDSLEPSHVLLALGLSPELAHGSIRFSLGRDNTESDIDYVLEKLPSIIAKIRKMSTAYRSKK